MNGIGLREASLKYNVPRATLSDWASRGLIRIVRHAERRGQAMLLFEPDVAALAAQPRERRNRWTSPTLETIPR